MSERPGRPAKPPQRLGLVGFFPGAATTMPGSAAPRVALPTLPADAMPDAQMPTLTPEPASYEHALAELEQLVQAMEAGRLPLDQLMDSHRRATALLAFCRERLQALESQVQLLDAGTGQPIAWSAA